MVTLDADDERKQAGAASVADITEMYLMYDYPIPIANAVNRRLVVLSLPSSFHVMSKVLPDRPRAANDSYMSQVAAYLARLAEKRESVEWLPSWLSPGQQGGAPLDGATERFLDQCLTYFKDYEPYRLVLLAAWAIRRCVKINVVALGAIQKLGSDLHLLARFMLPETSWAQVLASPELQLLGLIDSCTRTLLDDYIRRNTAEDGSFKAESAKLELRGYWNQEKRLLAALPNYRTLLQERNLHDPRTTEYASVTYDNLGHYTIARLHPFPKWRSHLLQERRELVEEVAPQDPGQHLNYSGFRRSCPSERCQTRTWFPDSSSQMSTPCASSTKLTKGGSTLGVGAHPPRLQRVFLCLLNHLTA
jgi:hypothetical protein